MRGYRTQWTKRWRASAKVLWHKKITKVQCGWETGSTGWLTGLPPQLTSLDSVLAT
jgi:hypothetical protein